MGLKILFYSKQNHTKQDIYQTLMDTSLYYKNFLNSKFPGLKPTDNLLSLITTLASNIPNSTIAVKAANEQSQLNQTDVELELLLHFFSVHFDNEVIDMKNGFVYFISHQAGKGLNYSNVDELCRFYPYLSKDKAQYAMGNQIVFFSDQQIRDFLNLYKMSKYCMLYWKLKIGNTLFILL